MSFDPVWWALAKKRGGGGGGDNWIGDGNTHIWITLQDGRTSPMLGVCPNGTVTVDWGDGSAPDTLTGTSTSTVKWTPNHEYGKAGDYVITLTVDGEVVFSGGSSETEGAYILRHSSSDYRNKAYLNSVQKVELGDGVTKIGEHGFRGCYSLTNIAVSDSVTSIGKYAFRDCYSLASVSFSDSVTSIGNYAFMNCYSLTRFAIPDSVTNIGEDVFENCYNLASISIPDSVTSISYSLFYFCYSLASISIPDSVTSISGTAFMSCYSLASIAIPGGVTSIGTSAFKQCYGIAYYDFSNHTAVPSLKGTNAFDNIASDCQIRVPAALVDEWKAATNWATYADKIVGV